MDPELKKGYKVVLEDETVANSDFRRVLYTNDQMQLVLMSLKPGEEIGLETHPENDQFFRFDAGQGKVIINHTSYDVKDGDGVIVPHGAAHNVLNTSETEDLKFYTIYSPAHHKDQIVRHTKKEAEELDEEFDGETTE